MEEENKMILETFIKTTIILIYLVGVIGVSWFAAGRITQGRYVQGIGSLILLVYAVVLSLAWLTGGNI